MPEYVTKEAVKQAMRSQPRGILFTEWELNQVPTVDVAEVVHGQWVEEYVYASDPHDRLRYKCSVCGRTEEDKEPYCNCGAKMDGGINR